MFQELTFIYIVLLLAVTFLYSSCLSVFLFEMSKILVVAAAAAVENAMNL